MAMNTDGYTVPTWLHGRHFTTESEVVEGAERLITENIDGVTYSADSGRSFQMENCPDVLVSTGGGEPYDMSLYIPLPMLHYSELTCADIQTALAPCIPSHTRLEVKVHPGPEDM